VVDPAPSYQSRIDNPPRGGYDEEMSSNNPTQESTSGSESNIGSHRDGDSDAGSESSLPPERIDPNQEQRYRVLFLNSEIGRVVNEREQAREELLERQRQLDASWQQLESERARSLELIRRDSSRQRNLEQLAQERDRIQQELEAYQTAIGVLENRNRSTGSTKILLLVFLVLSTLWLSRCFLDMPCSMLNQLRFNVTF
jgi:chromosome segregation ATPase